MADTEHRPSPRRIRSLALILGVALMASPAAAAGVDSRAYTCSGLQSLIATHGFVFISQATFGDFVVARRSYCSDGDILQRRSVATADNPECPVNYCVSRDVGSRVGGGM